MMQFSAILLDTWRLLRARKLFWIAMAITVIVGLFYASIGYNENGWSVFFALNIPDADNARGTPGASTMAFNAFYGVTQWWTTFFGMILGLVACASIFPEFMAAGSIDTLLSKPISRGRLFLAKFLSALLFAALQVIVLAVMVFASIRWRLGFWHWPVFWSVPLAVIFFSYLYAICVLFGVWTRSTLAALTLTLIVWAGCGSLGFAEGVAASLSHASVVMNGSEQGSNVPTLVYRIVRDVRVILPKTAETTELVQRSVMRETERIHKREEDIEDATRGRLEMERMFGKKNESGSVIRERVKQELEFSDELKRSPAYILGTSLLFEAFVLALGCWMFSRRDY